MNISTAAVWIALLMGQETVWVIYIARIQRNKTDGTKQEIPDELTGNTDKCCHRSKRFSTDKICY